ncbi:MAG: glycosyltransferase 87 family protein [Chloroflexota bacterium]
MSTDRPSIAGSGRSTVVMAVLAGLAAAAFLAGPVAWAAGNLREGFPGYFTASRLVIEGRWSPSVYDDTTFARETLAVTDGRIGEIYRPNPPVTSLVMLPIAGLDLMTARRAWLGLEVALVAVTWLLLLGALPALRAPPLALGVLALTLVWAPLQLDLRMGQVYVPVLALHAAALLAIARGRARGTLVAGVALGAAAAAKLAALPWLVVLLLRRGRRLAVATAVATAAVLAGLTLGYAGIDGWSAFASTAWHDLTADRPSLAVTAYQSTAGFLRHLLTTDATWNPGGLADLPLVARGLGLAVSAWVAVVTILVARRGRVDLVAAFAVTGGVLALNVAQDYAYTLLLLPAAVGLARCAAASAGRRAWTAWLAIAIALIAAPLPYRDPAFDAGWLALLAYPRLYGAWLLWAWLAREIGLQAAADTSPQRAMAETR